MFHSSVVIEASASPATFSRTFIAASKQRTKIRPPSAPPTSEWAKANSLAWLHSTTKAKPRCASSSSPRAVGVMSSSPLKDSPARVVAEVVEVATTARPSTPISVALWRKASARPSHGRSSGPHSGSFGTVAGARSAGTTSNPYIRTEDVSAVIDHLTTVPYVDKDRIGAMGICAGAGYSANAAIQDRRIKAIGTVSAVNIGSMFRNGWENNVRSIDALPLVEAGSNARTTDALGKGYATMPLAPLTEKDAPNEELRQA